jgi:nucleoside-diphosphate-sugar epimerase
MKKILVTGATGFIGRFTIDPLRALGYEIHTVSREPAKAAHLGPDIRIARGDLLDASFRHDFMARERFSHLLHLAWYAEHGKFWTAPQNLDWLAVSVDLIHLFAQHGGTRVVGAGTCAEYDWSYGFCSEDLTPLKPRTLYGVAKRALGEVLLSYARQIGLSAAWGRIFFTFGPYEAPSRFVASVIRALLRSEPAPAHMAGSNGIFSMLKMWQVPSRLFSIPRLKAMLISLQDRLFPLQTLLCLLKA